MHSQHRGALGLWCSSTLFTLLLSAAFRSLFLYYPAMLIELLVASWERRQEGSKSFEIPHVSKYLFYSILKDTFAVTGVFRSELTFLKVKASGLSSAPVWLARSMDQLESRSILCDPIFPPDVCRVFHCSRVSKFPNGGCVRVDFHTTALGTG